MTGLENPNGTDEVDDQFKVWIADQGEGNQLGLAGATVKLGPRVCKTVMLRQFGDPATGEVSKRELRVSKFDRGTDGAFDFDDPSNTWFVENEEIDKVMAFLNEVLSAGRYRIVDADSPISDLLDVLSDKPGGLEGLLDALTDSAGVEAVAEALTRSERSVTSAEIAVLMQRRELLDRAIQVADSPEATETQMQDIIGTAWWIFGGQYVGVVPRRQLLQLDEHDIPLVCADGSLHIVELKSPVIRSLVVRHRNHWIVGREVHEAVMQATNYIRSADELGISTQTNLREELGIEIGLRRVFATVVIGHRGHVRADGMPDDQLAVTLRTYNAALNRVQVVTYDELFDSASRSIEFDAKLDAPETQPPAAH